MAQNKLITSVQNPNVKNALKLMKKGGRDELQEFLIEGYRETKRAADARVVIKQLFVCRELFLGTNEDQLIQEVIDLGAEIIECSKVVFAKMSYRDRPDGILAIAKHPKEHKLQELLEHKKNLFLLVAEGIEKPGNLGTIIRSADAAGVHGVIVCDKCTDVYNPNVVRSSIGTLFTCPIFEESKRNIITFLKKNKIKIIATTPYAKQIFTNADLTGPVAIVVGTEQLGLSEEWLKEADVCVKIPMLGAADSLNVATASTLVMYEVVRQRS